MPNNSIGLLSFLSFAFSIIAAVLAIDMYRLLRTGEYGKTWGVLIITSVMFALLQALRLAKFLNVRAVATEDLSEIVELVFVISLAYTFYLQRQTFTLSAKLRDKEDDNAHLTDALESADKPRREAEWNRLTGHAPDYDTAENVVRSDVQIGDDEIEWDARPTPLKN